MCIRDSYHGDILDEVHEDAIDMGQYQQLIAATDNDSYNALICGELAPEIGHDRVSRVAGEATGASQRLGRVFTIGGTTIDTQLDRLHAGWTFGRTRITEKFPYADSVSYTHLDVYKRQAYYGAGLPFELAALFGGVMVVTGPTVIAPMLRSLNIAPRVKNMLKWEAVSYTHLDVYKRQLAGALIGLSCQGNSTAELNGVSVSYTHLDVYKRQVLAAARGADRRRPASRKGELVCRARPAAAAL